MQGHVNQQSTELPAQQGEGQDNAWAAWQQMQSLLKQQRQWWLESHFSASAAAKLTHLTQQTYRPDDHPAKDPTADLDMDMDARADDHTQLNAHEDVVGPAAASLFRAQAVCAAVVQHEYNSFVLAAQQALSEPSHQEQLQELKSALKLLQKVHKVRIIFD